jgi:hypothetical protein
LAGYAPNKGVMSADNSKPSQKPGAGGAGQASAPQPKAKTTGRVQFDDRGNAVWEWSLATGAFGREVSTERLQKLEHPALSLADDGPSPFDSVRANPHGTKKGYDPYDSGKLGKPPTPAKKDLRKLGDWLKLKKQAAGNKDEE